MMLLQLEAAVHTSSGKVRTSNEDNYYLNGRVHPLEQINQEQSISIQGAEDQMIFAVCDGMGGLELGERASTYTASGLRTLQDSLNADRLEHALPRWIQTINQQVFEQYPGSGTTLAMIYRIHNSLQVAHLGDSRVYRLHQNELLRLTKDHSEINRLLRLGLIQPEDVKTHPLRHAINRYIGIDPSKYRCEADLIDPLPLEEGDRYLICSDGVTDMLSDSSLLALMAQDGSSASIAEKIHKAAMDAGGEDNITALVITVLGEETKRLGKRKSRKKGKRIGLAILLALIALLMVLMAARLFPRHGMPPHAIIADPVLPDRENADSPQDTGMEKEDCFHVSPQGTTKI